MSDVETTSSFDALADAKYVRLTTFRKTGTPVATPVWCAVDAGSLYAFTGEGTGKVKRIRNEPRVTVGACTGSGTPTGSRLRRHSPVAHRRRGPAGVPAREGPLPHGQGRLRGHRACHAPDAQGHGHVGIAVEPSPTVDLPGPP